MIVKIVDAATSSFNGIFTITGIVNATQFTVANVGPDTALIPAAGNGSLFRITEFNIINVERISGIAIYELSTDHDFATGDLVNISNVSIAGFNGDDLQILDPSLSPVVAPNQFKIAIPGVDVPLTFQATATVYKPVPENARAWAAPDVLLTPQTKAGVNSLITVAGINHFGENGLFQNLQFYDFGVGIADAETFILKSFLSMDVAPMTKGATVKNVDFGYQGRNFVQSVLYPGQAESNTQCAIGGYSALQNPINVVSRSAGIATFTCVMQHTLRVGDVVAVSGFSDGTFNGTWTILSTPDSYRFTATTGGPDILPGLYIDGNVIMLRAQRIFASGCVFEQNRITGGPNVIDQQSPVTAITVRDTDGAEIRDNNFDGFTGTCFYVDSFYHYRTHIHRNSCYNISAFVALVVQDWYRLTSDQLFSVNTAAHKSMLIENNDVLLTGPNSWFYQTAFAPLDAPFLINNHDVDRTQWYYPTDYRVPISTSTRAAGISTHTTASAHELQTGMTVSVVSVPDGTFNGVFTVTSTPSPTTFTVANAGTPTTEPGGANSCVGINEPIQFPWEVRPIGFQRTAGVATYTTNKAHHLQLNWHATVEGFSDSSFNDEVIVTSTPTPTTFTCSSPGPDVAFTSEVGNFFRYVDDIQIGCNTVGRLSGNGLVVNNGGTFGGSFLQGRPSRCVAPLDQFFYFDCPEGCLALECDPGPCKPNDYTYRI